MERKGLLEGRWILVDGKVVEDETCREIRRLTSQVYVEVAQDQTGWIRLFRDSESGGYWELDYPQSECHGAGPPRLRKIERSDIGAKYGSKFPLPDA